MTRVDKLSVSATELAKLGKCELLISARRHGSRSGNVSGYRREQDAPEIAAAKDRGDRLHAIYEREAGHFLTRAVPAEQRTRVPTLALYAAIALGVTLALITSL